MPRNISFALTTPQFTDRSKTVTRRTRWLNLKVGDELMGVEKCMGLGRGGKIKRIRLIRITKVTREQLGEICNNIGYGFAEMIREGFPPPHELHNPFKFVRFFCEANKGCTNTTIITRIEFEHLADA